MSCRRGSDGDLDVHDSDGVRILGPHLDGSPRLGGRLLEHLDAVFLGFTRYRGG